ncbi:MAG: hypothetical protein ACRDGA_01600 [Bacteroidota bacterium]
MALLFRHLTPFCLSVALCIAGSKRSPLQTTTLVQTNLPAAVHTVPTPAQPSSRGGTVVQQQKPESILRVLSTTFAVQPTFGPPAPRLIVAILDSPKCPSCSDGVLAPYASRDPPSA